MTNGADLYLTAEFAQGALTTSIPRDIMTLVDHADHLSPTRVAVTPLAASQMVGHAAAHSRRDR
jgi:hypothetical protein